jgi:hypothetical protein
MAGGAIIVANNCKLRNLVKKNQEDVMKKAEEYIDSKLSAMGVDTANLQSDEQE